MALAGPTSSRHHHCRRTQIKFWAINSAVINYACCYSIQPLRCQTVSSTTKRLRVWLLCHEVDV
ncbi:hypothetical protein KSS87_013839 [Heliosperma pusillum]|nr:hypothetical protein KSS87_013839 [Heliosperma pusillum]